MPGPLDDAGGKLQRLLDGHEVEHERRAVRSRDRLEAGADAELDGARTRPPAEPVVHHQQAVPAQAPVDRGGRRQLALDARQARQDLGAVDRDHDLVEAGEVTGDDRRPQPQLDV